MGETVQDFGTKGEQKPGPDFSRGGAECGREAWTGRIQSGDVLQEVTERTEWCGRLNREVLHGREEDRLHLDEY